MKKSLVLMLLCLLLCAVSTAAYAETITFKDAGNEKHSKTVDGDSFVLPEYSDISAEIPDGKEFYGWFKGSSYGLYAFFKPGATVDVSG